jgi:hypothetical protein
VKVQTTKTVGMAISSRRAMTLVMLSLLVLLAPGTRPLSPWA